MIVELCGTDLLELVNGRQIVVSDVIVRTTEADTSKVLGESLDRYGALTPNPTPHGGSNRTAAQVSASRRSSRAAVTKTGQRWMQAIYPHGRCAAACTNTWEKGDLMLYDYDTRRSLCPEHGVIEFPNLPIPEELRRLALERRRTPNTPEELQ
jgi:hypothetical protein